MHEAGEGHLILILELTHQSGTPLGEQEASVLLACVVGRANVLENRLWSLVLFRELFFTCWEWMGVHSIKHWSWSHILTPTLRWKNDFWSNGWIMSGLCNEDISSVELRPGFGRRISETNCKLRF